MKGVLSACLGLGLLVVFLCVGVSGEDEGAAARVPAVTLSHAPNDTPTVTNTPDRCAPVWAVITSPNPNTIADQLDSVAVVSANDVWAVGIFNSGGPPQTLTEHWDGTAWSVIASPNPSMSYNWLGTVAAVSNNDVWAVGFYSNGSFSQTLVEHWDGISWSVVPSPNNTYSNYLYGVTAVSANDVWAVGDYYDGSTSRTLVEHWDGTVWSLTTGPSPGTYDSLYGVTAISANDVWAVGVYSGGTLEEHWDGSDWSVAPGPNVSVGSDLNRIAVVSTNDVWAVGRYYTNNTYQTLTEHWDGISWSVVPSPSVGTGHNELGTVSAVSSSDVWVVGDYSNGSVYQTLVEHWDGTAWSVVASPNAGMNSSVLAAVAAVSGDDVWAVGYYGDNTSTYQTLVEHYASLCTSNSTPTDTPTYTPANTATYTPTSTPTVTNTPDPCAPVWSVVSSPNVGTGENYLQGVAAISANDVWAVGLSQFGNSGNQTLVEYWNGTSWSVVSSPNPGTNNNVLNGVVAVSANDVWAVGTYRHVDGVYLTLVEHWDGSSWSVVSSPSPGEGGNELYEVAPVSANDMWAVGNYYSYTEGNWKTLIEHWDGSSWSVLSSPSVGTGYNILRGVAAVSANDVWAVGDYFDGGVYLTLVEHWDGSDWAMVSSPNVGTSENSLFGITAVSINDVWVAGTYRNGSDRDQTLVEHWDGSSWSVVSSPNPSAINNWLNGVAALSANDVWTVGVTATNNAYQTLVEHWDGSSWSVVPSPNVGTDRDYLQGVAALSANDMWAVGDYFDGSTTRTLVERYISPCALTGTPTNTPTSTITSTPTPIPVLIGHVNWQGPPAQPNARQQQPITLTLKLGATEVNYPSQSTDASGFFTVSLGSLPAGAYEWRAKGPKYLAGSGVVNLVGAPGTQVEMGLMRAGDANNDNLVSVADANIVRRTFGLCIGDVGYDARGDFDNSNCVSVVDFNLLRSNFGFGGAPPIGVRGK